MSESDRKTVALGQFLAQAADGGHESQLLQLRRVQLVRQVMHGRRQLLDPGRQLLQAPAELGLSYRQSKLEQGQVVARAEFRLEPRDPAEIKATVAELQALRKAAQPTNKRTFGSVFKNPDHELTAGLMLEACGLKGHRIGGAQISPRHANFIENADGARAADAIGLMAEARRRVFAEYGVELEHEVQFLGPLSLPALGE